MGVGKDTQSTQVIYRTDSPVWERGFTCLVKNPETDTFTLKVRYPAAIGFYEKVSVSVSLNDFFISYNLSLFTGNRSKDKP